ncbi:MAG: energy-coupling factor transporter transmembrane component T [Tissierellia bacterium]|nr:energy-coupling factor transporter transmembrane component T [Tissierellia bacterium]
MNKIIKINQHKWNPNPMTKLIILLVLSFTIKTVKGDWATLGIVSIFSLLYILLGRVKDGMKNMILYLLLFGILKYGEMENISLIVAMFVTVAIIIKIFYLPFMAGAFLIKTTDVGSIISSMDTLHITKKLSIPIATMFRFGPSFKEEYKNIRFAMKMRGISLKNPLLAMEYIYVPLLSISSVIAEDIAKYAETKALSDPCKKIRLKEVSFGMVDLLFLGSIVTILVVDVV